MAEGGIRPTELGSGLAEAFELLSQASEERLLSLTSKMGSTRAEVMVHAMCLIHLKKSEDAFGKLSANGEGRVAKFLAEMIKVHGEKLNSSHIGSFNVSGPDIETLLDIARVFAVLVQERLCDKSLRDQAYHKAYAIGLGSIYAENIFDEMRKVCGLQAVDEFPRPASQTGGLTSLDMSGRNVSHPSSLRSSSNCSSRTLEISSPTITDASMEEPKPMTLRTTQNSETTSSQSQALQCPTNISPPNAPQTAEVINGSTLPKPKQCMDHNVSSQLLTSKNTNPGLEFSSSNKLGSQPANVHVNKPPHTQSNFISQAVSSIEPDDTFYAFVILHEPEDADEAERLKDKLESIISGVGATFSEMEEPGRSTLGCLEDAISNSAFTLLLLTRNFNTNLSETSTDTAIFNSLEKLHKKNSVIPLLPQKNCLPKDRLRLVLRSTVPLDEKSKTFERNALKAMAPEKIASQKQVWMKEQRIKMAIKEQKRIQEDRARNMDLQRETERLERLRLQSNMLYAQSAYPRDVIGRGCGPMPTNVDAQHGAWQQPPSCIHIENAQNVMIGNHSTMNIDHDHGSGDDD